MGLDVVDNHLELGQLNLNDLWVTVDWLQRVQSLVGPLDPDEQLAKSVLELSQSEKGVLQLLLPDHNRLVEIAPSPVDLGQRLLDSPSLIRRSSLSEVVSLPKLENFNQSVTT